jgi:vacuolar iron transporter family protein
MPMSTTASPTSPSPPSRADVARFRANLQDETDSAFLYSTLAALQDDASLADVYRRLSEVEARHAEFWRARLREAGAADGRPRPTRRARILAWAARRFGAQAILPSLVANERTGAADYLAQPETAGTPLAADEHGHAAVLRALSSARGGVEGPAIGRLEGRHRAVGGNALRAAVLGANDGLVSNLSLVMGVAGAELSGRGILITGLAGLLAGAGSMAMGEWLSVQSSRELNQRQLDVEAEELRRAPEEEAEELALIYRAKGLAPDQADALARRIVAEPRGALDTLAREELGIDPAELGGSAMEAAVTSFILFSIGAVIPVVPFLFLAGGAAVAASIVASGVALFGVGAAITLLTGRGVLFSGFRQLGIGLAAAGLTWAVGRLIGTSIGG